MSENGPLQAMLDNPDDDRPRLAYADWLDKSGSPHSAAIRASRELIKLLASLGTAPSVPLGRLDNWASAGRIDLLAALAFLLDGSRDLIRNNREPSILGWTLSHLEELLALTPGEASVEALLGLLIRGPVEARSLPGFASRLAGGQAQEFLIAALDRHAGDETLFELWACLLHEMVVRGCHLPGLPAVERFREQMRARGHPLRELPLDLTAMESGLAVYVPCYSSRSSSWHTPPVPSEEPSLHLPLTTDGTRPTLSEFLDDVASRRIAAAVCRWREVSNGRVEARVFRATTGIVPNALSVSMLRGLGLEPLSGADIQAERIRPSRALDILFSAACNGGADGGSLLGAYGRREAWRSLAGLAGAPNDENIEEVAAVAERCVWASFMQASGWFYQVAWDIGLVAVRADGMSLAVLAATDTD
jgi:uncharacterized protein (TIGR02996 family)